MAKAKRKKPTEFKTEQTKSVFFFGNPNKDKTDKLRFIQKTYTSQAQLYIDTLYLRHDLSLQIIKNDKKDSKMRSIEKSLRPKQMNSAFSQNAFDCAVTKLSTRLDNIRQEMRDGFDNIFTSSKVLFALSVMKKSQNEMISVLEDIVSQEKEQAKNRAEAKSVEKSNNITQTGNKRKSSHSYHEELLSSLKAMNALDFKAFMNEFELLYIDKDIEFKVPSLSNEMVILDTRIMRFEESKDIKAPYVLTVSDIHKGGRITIPLNDTTAHSKTRMKQYKKASSVAYSVLSNGTLKVQIAVTRTNKTPSYTKTTGTDTGIKDCFHTSDGKAIGTMVDIISFYKDVVEPALGDVSDIRNKIKKISHYLRRHKNTLPKSVKDALILKMNHLNTIVQTVKAPYRKRNEYKNKLDHEIRKDVNEYIDSIDKETLTVLELLDIKEFNKSRKLNGELSVFARGKLQKTLMDTLSWKGYPFIEVPADYTSQICPECHFLSKGNRSTEDSKNFTCTCCGYHNDADYVGALNIKERAEDKGFIEICNNDRFAKKKFQKDIIDYCDKLHTAWLECHKEAAEDIALIVA